MDNSEIRLTNPELNEEVPTLKPTEKRTLRGFKLAMAGAVLLVLGCITTMVTPISHPVFDPLLYGVTSLGAGMVLFGLYLVFE